MAWISFALVAIIGIREATDTGGSVEFGLDGLALAAIGAALVTANVILRQIASDSIKAQTSGAGELDTAVVANFVSRVAPAMLVVSIPGDLWSLVSFDDVRASSAVLTLGVLVLTLNNVFYLMAVNVADFPTISALRYSGPVLATIWLLALGEIDQLDVEVGLALSVLMASSFFTVLDPRRELETTVMVIGSILIGLLVGLTPGLDAGSAYFDAVAGPLVVFAIIVAVLVERAKSIRDEEDRIEIAALLLTKKRDSLEQDLDAIRALSAIDAFEYLQRRDIENTHDEKIGEMMRALVASRCLSSGIGESIALVATTLLSLFITIAFRPSGVLFDLFAVALASTLVFLAAWPMGEFSKRSRAAHARLLVDNHQVYSRVIPLTLGPVIVGLQMLILYNRY